MFFSGYEPAENSASAGGVRARRATRSSTIAEPEGDVAFHWVLATPMSCDFSLAHYRELLRAARAGGYRWAGFDAPPDGRRPDPAARRRPVARGRARGRGGRGGGRSVVDVVPDDALGLLQPRVGRGRAGDRAPAGARPSRRASRRLAARRPRRALRSGRRVAQPRSRVHARADRRRGERDGGAVLRSRPLPLRLEPALAARLPARRARARGSSSGCSCSRIRRSGRSTGRRCASRWSRCSTPTAPRGSSTCGATGSTCRDRDPLAGGDMNVVVRVGDTVRRPPEPSHVIELLQWYERVGFDGAPRSSATTIRAARSSRSSRPAGIRARAVRRTRSSPRSGAAAARARCAGRPRALERDRSTSTCSGRTSSAATASRRLSTGTARP